MITGELCKTCNHPDDCHKEEGCHFNQHGAVTACSCTAFVSPTAEAVKLLAREERARLSAANFLGGIDPHLISKVEIAKDGGGHNVAVEITVRVHTGRQAGQWLADHLPKEALGWVLKYLYLKGKEVV